MVHYEIGSWGVTLQNNWMAGFSRVTQPGQVYLQPRVPSFDTVDLTLDKQLEIAGGAVDLYLSVQNIANTEAPLDVTNTSTPGNSNPVNSYQNDMGRYFTLGLRGNL